MATQFNLTVNLIEDIAIKMMKIEKIGRLNYDQIFLYRNIAHTNKWNKKMQSPGALNIQETPEYNQKDNVKN